MQSTRNNGYTAIAVAAIAVAWLGPAHAQESGKVMIDVADCIKLAAPEARLACYESRVAAVFGERAAQAAAARPAAPAAAAVTATPIAPTPTQPATAAVPVPSATPSPAPRAVAVMPAPAAASAEPPVQTRSDRQSRRAESERAEADAVANEIVSQVKELREVFPNAWQITLENGQVWRQSVSKRFELRAGTQVKIYTTHWGNAYRLSADKLNGYIQVERVH